MVSSLLFKIMDFPRGQMGQQKVTLVLCLTETTSDKSWRENETFSRCASLLGDYIMMAFSLTSFISPTRQRYKSLIGISRLFLLVLYLVYGLYNYFIK